MTWLAFQSWLCEKQQFVSFVKVSDPTAYEPLEWTNLETDTQLEVHLPQRNEIQDFGPCFRLG
jgi:hypothetical protein